MDLTTRYRNALALAFDVHAGDVRKGKAVPYISHPMSVSALVLENGGSEDEAIAALLHDVLEDHPETITFAELSEQFGCEVADIVRGCSDTPDDYTGGDKPAWKGRKRSYLKHLRSASTNVLRVALADKLHNCRDLRNDLRTHGKKVWERFNADKKEQLWYYDQLLRIFAQRLDAHSQPMLLQFKEVLNETRRDGF
jgi:(p)ppGpp synthase/HD superfamily hydrolase